MATLTTTDDLRVINERINRTPDNDVVAGFAQIGGTKVSLTFAGGARSIMAIHASLSCNGIMIK